MTALEALIVAFGETHRPDIYARLSMIEQARTERAELVRWLRELEFADEQGCVACGGFGEHKSGCRLNALLNPKVKT